MTMRRLSTLMLRKWRNTEGWAGRRRSEPFWRVEEWDAEGEEEEERRTDVRKTHRRMLRRSSEPCGQTDGEGDMRETKNCEKRREYKRSKTREEQDCRRQENRGGERRKSTSCVMVEDIGGCQGDRLHNAADRKAVRRRSEPCGVLYVQLLPLSFRKRRDLLLRRTGRRLSCSKEGAGAEDRMTVGQMCRGTSEPVGPLDNSKVKFLPVLSWQPGRVTH